MQNLSPKTVGHAPTPAETVGADERRLKEIGDWSDEWAPFYSANRATAPRRQPLPGVKLSKCYLERDPCALALRLRDHGAYGIEAQFWENEVFRYSRRFDTGGRSRCSG
jgi:hypothetical protein